MTDAQIIAVLEKYLERPSQMSGWEPLLRGIREIVETVEGHTRRNHEQVNLALKSLLERRKNERDVLRAAVDALKRQREADFRGE